MFLLVFLISFSFHLVDIKKSTFRNIRALRPLFVVDNCNIHDEDRSGTPYSFTGECPNSVLHVISSKFHDELSNDSPLSLFTPSAITMTDNTFSNNIATKGGAMHVKGALKVEIKANIFDFCAAKGLQDIRGGAILIEQLNGDFNLQSSSFSRCSVENENPNGATPKENDFQGGAIYVEFIDSSLTEENCEIYNNSFRNTHVNGSAGTCRIIGSSTVVVTMKENQYYQCSSNISGGAHYMSKVGKQVEFINEKYEFITADETAGALIINNFDINQTEEESFNIFFINCTFDRAHSDDGNSIKVFSTNCSMIITNSTKFVSDLTDYLSSLVVTEINIINISNCIFEDLNQPLFFIMGQDGDMNINNCSFMRTSCSKFQLINCEKQLSNINMNDILFSHHKNILNLTSDQILMNNITIRDSTATTADAILFEFNYFEGNKLTIINTQENINFNGNRMSIKDLTVEKFNSGNHFVIKTPLETSDRYSVNISDFTSTDADLFEVDCSSFNLFNYHVGKKSTQQLAYITVARHAIFRNITMINQGKPTIELFHGIIDIFDSYFENDDESSMIIDDNINLYNTTFANNFNDSLPFIIIKETGLLMFNDASNCIAKDFDSAFQNNGRVVDINYDPHYSFNSSNNRCLATSPVDVTYKSFKFYFEASLSVSITGSGDLTKDDIDQALLLAQKFNPAINEVKKIIFNGNVTVKSFLNNQELIELIFYSENLNIDTNAFSNCINLQKLEIIGETFSIGEKAFSDCSKLTSVSICSDLTEIGNLAFNNCLMLSSFAYSGSTKPENNLQIFPKDINFDLFVSNKYEYDSFAEKTDLIKQNNEISIDNIKMIIEDECITIEAINNVEINPEVIKNMADTYKCRCSKELNIHINGTSLKVGSFEGNDELVSIVFANTGVTTFVEGTFKNCISLVNIGLPQNINTIPQEAFSNCVSLKEIIIQEKVKIINSMAFKECKSLEKVHFLSSIDEFHEDIFMNCIKLTTLVYCGKTVPTFSDALIDTSYNVSIFVTPSYESDTFSSRLVEIISFEVEHNYINYKFDQETFEIRTIAGEGVISFSNAEIIKSLGLQCPCMLNEFKTLRISGNGITIPEDAFADRTNIQSIDFQSYSDFEIGNKAFKGCTSLTSLHLSEGLAKIGYDAFYLTDITELLIPISCKYIGKSAFEDNKRLAEVKIAGNIDIIGDNVFRNCLSLNYFVYCGSEIPKKEFSYNTNEIFTSSKGSYANNVAVHIHQDYKGTSFCGATNLIRGANIIEINGITMFLDGSKMNFKGSGEASLQMLVDNINELICPCNYISIIEFVFEDNISIGDNGFKDCNAFKIEFKSSEPISIGKNAFERSYNLNEIKFPDYLLSMGEKSFTNSQFFEIYIPKCDFIGLDCFSDCFSLRIVHFTDEFSFTSPIFYNCYDLWKVYYCSDVAVAGNLFNGANPIIEVPSTYPSNFFAEIQIQDSDKTANTFAVYQSQAMFVGTELEITSGDGYISRESIDQESYNRCPCMVDKMTKIKVLKNENFEIGNFSGLQNLISFEIIGNGLQDTRPIILDGAFANCNNLAVVKLESNFKSIGMNAFENCAMTTITLPDDLILSDFAFKDCNKLTTVTFSGTVFFGVNIFDGCTSLNKIIYCSEIPPKLNLSRSTIFPNNQNIDIEVNSEYKGTKFAERVITEANKKSNVLEVDGMTFKFVGKSVTISGTGMVSSNSITNAYERFIKCQCEKELVSLILEGEGIITLTGFASHQTLIDVLINCTCVIEASAFKGCIYLYSVEFGSKTQSIGPNAFENCYSLFELTLPVVASIGAATFKNCNEMTMITIPEGVNTIAEDSFSGCSMINTVIYQGQTDISLEKDLFASTRFHLSIFVTSEYDSDYFATRKVEKVLEDDGTLKSHRKYCLCDLDDDCDEVCGDFYKITDDDINEKLWINRETEISIRLAGYEEKNISIVFPTNSRLQKFSVESANANIQILTVNMTDIYNLKELKLKSVDLTMAIVQKHFTLIDMKSSKLNIINTEIESQFLTSNKLIIESSLISEKITVTGTLELFYNQGPISDILIDDDKDVVIHCLENIASLDVFDSNILINKDFTINGKMKNIYLKNKDIIKRFNISISSTKSTQCNIYVELMYNGGFLHVSEAFAATSKIIVNTTTDGGYFPVSISQDCQRPVVTLASENIDLTVVGMNIIKFMPRYTNLRKLFIKDVTFDFISVNSNQLILGTIYVHLVTFDTSIYLDNQNFTLDASSESFFGGLFNIYVIKDAVITLEGNWGLLQRNITIYHNSRPLYIKINPDSHGEDELLFDTKYGVYFIPWKVANEEKYCICNSVDGETCDQSQCRGFKESQVLSFENYHLEFASLIRDSVEIRVAGSSIDYHLVLNDHYIKQKNISIIGGKNEYIDAEMISKSKSFQFKDINIYPINSILMDETAFVDINSLELNRSRIFHVVGHSDMRMRLMRLLTDAYSIPASSFLDSNIYISEKLDVKDDTITRIILDSDRIKIITPETETTYLVQENWASFVVETGSKNVSMSVSNWGSRILTDFRLIATKDSTIHFDNSWAYISNVYDATIQPLSDTLYVSTDLDKLPGVIFDKSTNPDCDIIFIRKTPTPSPSISQAPIPTDKEQLVSFSQTMSVVRSYSYSISYEVSKSISLNYENVQTHVRVSSLSLTLSAGSEFYINVFSNSITNTYSFVYYESKYVQIISYPFIFTTLSNIELNYYTLVDKQKKAYMSGELLIGIAVGSVAIVFILVGIVVFIFRSKKDYEHFTSSSDDDYKEMPKKSNKQLIIPNNELDIMFLDENGYSSPDVLIVENYGIFPAKTPKKHKKAFKKTDSA